MSTADARGLRPGFDRVRRALSGPAFGLEPRRTAVGLAVVAAFLALLSTTLVLDRALELYAHWRLASTIDSLLWILVLTSQAAWVLAVGYALWNGGPATALGLAILPEAVESAVHLRLVLSIDVAVTLVVGSVAATIALVVTTRRRCGGVRPDRYAPLENGLLVTSTAAVVAIATYVEVLAWDLPTVFVPIDLIGVGLVPVVVVLAAYWRGWLAEASPSHSSPDVADGVDGE